MFENINEVAVLVAAIVAAAVGSIWYSPLLFGSLWMKSIGLTLEEGELPKREMIMATLKGLCVQVVLFFVVAEYISVSSENDISLVKMGYSLVAITAVYVMQGVIWEKRTLTYFFIQIGYTALSLCGGIAIIAYWPW